MFKISSKMQNLNEELIESVKTDNVINTKNLIKKGANIFYQNKKMRTPLYYAIKYRELSQVNCLIRNGIGFSNLLSIIKDEKILLKKFCGMCVDTEALD